MKLLWGAPPEGKFVVNPGPDYGHGTGYGSGYDNGSGSGAGYGYGSSYGSGSIYGPGSGNGYGYGYGAGYGSGHGYGSSPGYGYGDVYGHGEGEGSGLSQQAIYLPHEAAWEAWYYVRIEGEDQVLLDGSRHPIFAHLHEEEISLCQYGLHACLSRRDAERYRRESQALTCVLIWGRVLVGRDKLVATDRQITEVYS